MMSLCVLRVYFVVFILTVMDGLPTDSDDVQSNLIKQNAAQETTEQLDEVLKDTRGRKNGDNTTLASLLDLAFFKQLSAMSRASLTHELHVEEKWTINITDYSSQSDLDNMSNTINCSTVVCKNDCWSNRYRAINSVCNNRKIPHLGASNMPYIRWLPAEYEDGFSLPKGWTDGKCYNGFPLPLVRDISNKILKAPMKSIVSDSGRSQFFTQWGQWISHEISFTQSSSSQQTFFNEINCETSCVKKPPCFPIKVPPDDPRITGTGPCIPFTRSAFVCLSAFEKVNTCEQINTQTSYLDASNVYGTTENQAKKLRDFTNEMGLLKVNPTFSDHGLHFLPFRNCNWMDACTAANSSSFSLSTEAGDARADENMGLLSFHTIFLREHNRLARKLKRLNPHWSGETIYQETRKIIGAFQQIITYRDYIPRVIGKHATEKYLSQYQGYDESADPSLSNVFATAAMRFGHVTIQPVVKRYNENYQEDSSYPSKLLHNTLFTPKKLIKEGGIDPIVRGLCGSPTKLQTQTAMMPDELREKLVVSQHGMNQDLSSINIQRSRDHGLQGYNAWRRFCGLSAPPNLSALSLVLKNKKLAFNLLKLYGTPENIDVWVGGISEPFVEGGRVGPLFTCLIGQQYKNLRDGDRFWWENEGVFTANQRQALQHVSLAAAICDNTGIEKLPRDVFAFKANPNSYERCNRIPRINLSAWKERFNATCGPIPLVCHAFFSVCGSSVRYTCRSGLKLIGEDTITCLSNGLWNSAPPTCTA
ncbi:eosinophil peroxidase-like [Hypanus sabinus]|uniref:eosinophil peroxidase-like n=1 Tax=Hypanus sabinus TaxID=79690 RepID=UPI0028C46B4A|nr:eosinophil peroxidase-like [Hypanus sabinus]